MTRPPLRLGIEPVREASDAREHPTVNEHVARTPRTHIGLGGYFVALIPWMEKDDATLTLRLLGERGELVHALPMHAAGAEGSVSWSRSPRRV